MFCFVPGLRAKQQPQEIKTNKDDRQLSRRAACRYTLKDKYIQVLVTLLSTNHRIIQITDEGKVLATDRLRTK